MNSRNLVNLSLLVFLILAVTLFINAKDSENSTLRLTSLDINKIKNIEIHKANKPNIIFIKKPDNIWYMTKPYQVKAHQFRLNTLLGLTQAPVREAHDAAALNLADYALDKPRAHITFNETDILFGKTNPINNKRYLLAENKMLLINDQTYPLVSAHASSFINLSLLNDDFEIKTIKTPEIEIHREQNNSWKSTGNNILNADQIQSFLEHWRSAKAFAVHETVNKTTLGIISISSNDKTITFHITDDEPWLILSQPELNIEYHIDKSMKNILYGMTDPEPPNA